MYKYTYTMGTGQLMKIFFLSTHIFLTTQSPKQMFECYTNIWYEPGIEPETSSKQSHFSTTSTKAVNFNGYENTIMFTIDAI